MQIYIEEYVLGYLNDIKKKAGGLPIRAAIYGVCSYREDTVFYLIYGASGILDEMKNGRSQDEIHARYFPNYQMLGYLNIRKPQINDVIDGRCNVFYDSNERMKEYLLSTKVQKQKIKPQIATIFLYVIVIMVMASMTVILADYDFMRDFTVMISKAMEMIG